MVFSENSFWEKRLGGFVECVVSDELVRIVLVEDWDGDGTVEPGD